MFDPVSCQQDLTSLLLSAESLQAVQVKLYRKMRIQQELDYRTLLLPRGTKAGAGILVAMPVATCRNPNVTGPVLDWAFPIICIEQPFVNMASGGTQVSAEQMAQYVLDVLQLYADDLVGQFHTEPVPIQPEKEFVFPGCISYRVSFHVVGKSAQTQRVSALQVTPGAGQITLSTATAGATIRYTLDGSFPSNAGDNASSVTYTSPFNIMSGQVLRACAYKTGMINCATRYYLAP